MAGGLITIPARKGKAAIVEKGKRIRVVNTHGTQVVDFWAFNVKDPREFMSMEHCHTSLLRVIPRVGDGLVTNKRRAILTILEDTSPGIHDTVIAACDRYRYELLGCKTYHDNCTDNLAAGMAELGMTPPETPAPLNLFMNIPIRGDGSLSFDPGVCKPGDAITFRAEMDCVVAFSACPQDMVPINGQAMKVQDAHFEILG
jgi:uncharacterized protein YcgI (DUF1989 family)